MFGRVKETARGSRGQNLVEFALVVLVLAMILGAIVDLGRAFSTYIAMANAAREGARYGARLPCLALPLPGNQEELSDEIRKAVTDEASSLGVDLVAMGCPITLDPDPEVDGCGSWEAKDGSPLVVTVSCTFRAEMTRVTGVGDLNLTGQGTMAIFGNDVLYRP